MDFIEKVIRREPIWFRKSIMGNMTPTLIRGMAFIRKHGAKRMTVKRTEPGKILSKLSVSEILLFLVFLAPAILILVLLY